RTAHLADVPVAPRLVPRLLHRERPYSLREVAAEDDDVRPEVADEVGGEVPDKHARCVPERERREEDVVLEHLAGGLLDEGPHAPAELVPAHVPAEALVHLDVVQSDAPLED